MRFFPLTKVPLTINGCVVWIDSSDMSTITSSGGAVSAVVNKANNQSSFSQTTPSDRPSNSTISPSGYNSFLFSGGTDTLIAAPSQIINGVYNNGGTVITVFKIASSGGGGFGRIFEKGYGFFTYNDTSGTANFRLFQPASSATYIWTSTSRIITLNSINIVLAKYNAGTPGTSPTVYCNSLSASSMTLDSGGGTSTNDNSNSLYIGNAPALNRQIDGNFMEGIFIKGTTSSTQDLILMRYLSNKWGVTLS